MVSTSPPKGRTPTAIDLNLVESLAGVGCTVEEIAAELRISARTLQRREKQKAFGAAMERGRARGRASLRRAQWKSAQAGNVTAQIWLGKQMLGQRSFERPEDTQAAAPAPLIINTYADDRP